MQQKLINTSIPFGSNYNIKIKGVLCSGDRSIIFSTGNPELLVKASSIIENESAKMSAKEEQVHSYLATHKNIVRVWGSREIEFKDLGSRYKLQLVESCDHGSLQKIIDSYNIYPIPEGLIIEIVSSITQALLHLHGQSPPIVFRNFSFDNFLLGAEGKLKLSSFSKSKVMGLLPEPESQDKIIEDIYKYCPQEFRAPEQCDFTTGLPISEKTDIWALGILIFIMCFKKNPFRNLTQMLSGVVEFPEKEGYVYSKEIKVLISMMLRVFPKDRPSAEGIIRFLEQKCGRKKTLGTNIIEETSLGKVLKFSKAAKSDEKIHLKKPGIGRRLNSFLRQFSRKIEKWLYAVLEENDEGPKQKYVRYIIVLSWKDRAKIEELYKGMNKLIKKHINNPIVILKALIFLHNYFKKGPPEAMSTVNREHSPLDIIKDILSNWGEDPKEPAKGNSKVNMTLKHLIAEYAHLISQKLDFHIKFSSYFEGNYCISPFLKNCESNSLALGPHLIEKLFFLLESITNLHPVLLNIYQIPKIHTSLLLSLVDEEYCLISVISHLLVAFKQATNYLSNSNLNEELLKSSIVGYEHRFEVCLLSSSYFFGLCMQNIHFQFVRDMVPEINHAAVEEIKGIPILKQLLNEEFNVFLFLNKGTKVGGLSLPMSYGEALERLKIERMIEMEDSSRMISFSSNRVSISTEFHDFREFLHTGAHSKPTSKAGCETTIRNKKQIDLMNLTSSGSNSFSDTGNSPRNNDISTEKANRKINNTVPGHRNSETKALNSKTANLSFPNNNGFPTKQPFLETPKKGSSLKLTQKMKHSHSTSSSKAPKLDQNMDHYKTFTQISKKPFFEDLITFEEEPDNIKNEQELDPKLLNIIKNDESSDAVYSESSHQETNPAVFNGALKNKSRESLLIDIVVKVEEKEIKENDLKTQNVKPTNFVLDDDLNLIFQKESEKVNTLVKLPEQKLESKNDNCQTEKSNNTICSEWVIGGLSRNCSCISEVVNYNDNNHQEPINFSRHIKGCNFENEEIKQFMMQEITKNAQEWIIDYATLSFEHIIGTGSSSNVYKGLYRGSDVAIKKIKSQSLEENHLKEFQREIATLVKLRLHPNLVSLMGVSVRDQELCIITEFCRGGSLYQVLHKNKFVEISWKQRLKIALDIAVGMNYLHTSTPPIIHRDLKSLNLLLDNPVEGPRDYFTIKIADFGLARCQDISFKEKMTETLGTFHWMAPEIFDNKPYSLKADVFSYGIVLWEVCARETPYKNLTCPSAIIKYVTLDQGRPDLSLVPSTCPQQFKELMMNCWAHEPDARPSFDEIIRILRAINLLN